MHTLHKVQKLLGKLMHVVHVFPEWGPYLTNLKAMLTIFSNKPFVPHIPPKGMLDDIKW